MATKAPPRVVIATAGWAVPRDVADQFPGDGSALERYARVFSGVEINSTFWRRHRPSTFERWHDVTPARFQFALKLPRALTHEQKLARPTKVLREFFADVRGLRAKVGPLLLQLQPSLEFDRRRAAAFLRTLRAMHEGSIACEPRHASWLSEAADDLLVEHDIARVAADPARAPGLELPGGSRSLVYLRLHGSPVVYRSPYGPERIGAIAGQLNALPRRTRAWCVFDNTASGAAASDALLLRRRLR